jgi:CheY-like chemotaxis protein
MLVEYRCKVEKGMSMNKILLVDDEPDIVYLIKRILEKGGYEVVEAFSGQRGP